MRTEAPTGAGAATLALAFLAGALVGAAGALLLAPRSGAETRQRLGEAAGAAGERARRTRDAAAKAAAAAAKAFGDAMRDAQAP